MFRELVVNEMFLFKDCFRFFLETVEFWVDLIMGGNVFFILLIGWILNMGYCFNVV